MNANLDELLREGMTRFTADLHAPADLANRARRHRGQRLVLRTAASCAAAAIAIAAITIAAVGARPLGRPNVGQPVERYDIEYLRLTGSGPATPDLIWSYGQISRQLISSSAGRPREDDGEVVFRHPHGHLTVMRTIVEYASRTWARSRLGPFNTSTQLASTCARPFLGWPDSPASLPRWIDRMHQALDCGDYTIAGTPRIDGVKTIKLVAVGKLARTAGSVKTIWIKPSDYVPVREIGGQAGDWWQADISWLSPTTANLAQLNVPIPAGFRRVGIGDFPNALIPPVSGCRQEGNASSCAIVIYG